MKTLLTLTALLLSASAAVAGTTEAITGCATVAVDGSNYTTFADPTCPAQAKDGGDNWAFAGVEIVLDWKQAALEAAEEAAE